MCSQLAKKVLMVNKVEKSGKGKVKISISVPAKEMIGYFQAAYDELAPTVKIQGFRPGKAPQKLIESSLGIGRIVSEAIDRALNKEYFSALKEKNIIPISQPNIAINKYPNYGLEESEVKDDLEFEAEVEIYPEIEVADYSKIKIEAGVPEEVKEEDIEKILTHLRKQKAIFLEVNRAAQKGDLAEIDFEGFVKKVRIDSMCSKHHPLVLGEGSLIPGFEEEIIGMRAGEEKTFKIKFPENYQIKEYAGQEAEFKIKLLILKEIQLPELDDNFAGSFGQKTLKNLTEAIAKNLAEELKQKHIHEVEERILDRVLPLVKVEIPERLIDQEVERTIERYREQIKNQGLNFEGYLQSIKKDIKDFQKEIRPQAEKNVKIGLFLGKLIQEQKLDGKDPEAGRKALDLLVKQLTKEKS
jgi:trigger factor